MNRMDHRRGFTLLELLIAMSIATVILGINVGWIYHTMKFASVTKQQQQHHQNLTRLAWELRDDVHASKSISMVGEDQLVLTSEGGSQATYTISETEVLVEKRGDQPMVRRERFDLARDSTAVWDTSEMPEFISLIVLRGRETAVFKSENTGLPSVEEELNPVDLHVRVAPNRWTVKQADELRTENGKEEPK